METIDQKALMLIIAAFFIGVLIGARVIVFLIRTEDPPILTINKNLKEEKVL